MLEPDEETTLQETVTIAIVTEIIAQGGTEEDVEAIVLAMYP